jgi:hypothetical protein
MYEDGLTHWIEVRIHMTRGWMAREIFFSSQHTEQLWDPPVLLILWIPGPLPQRLSGQVVKLTTHLHLKLKSRMVEQYLHFPYVFLAQRVIN